MPEIWKPVRGYEGYYEVSNQGCVRSVSRTLGNGHHHEGKVLKHWVGNVGYHEVTLSVDGARRTHRVHQLVAEAFLGPCPDGHEVNHKDADKLNNQPENLEYVTVKGNADHADALGLRPKPPLKKGADNGKAQLTAEDVREIRRLHGPMSYNQLAERFGVSKTAIYDIIKGRSWAHVD